MPHTTVTAPELARELGVDPRTFRRFLRRHLPDADRPGSSKGRYHLNARTARELAIIWVALHPITHDAIQGAAQNLPWSS